MLPVFEQFLGEDVGVVALALGGIEPSYLRTLPAPCPRAFEFSFMPDAQPMPGVNAGVEDCHVNCLNRRAHALLEFPKGFARRFRGGLLRVRQELQCANTTVPLYGNEGAWYGGMFNNTKAIQRIDALGRDVLGQLANVLLAEEVRDDFRFVVDGVVPRIHVVQVDRTNRDRPKAVPHCSSFASYRASPRSAAGTGVDDVRGAIVG